MLAYVISVLSNWLYTYILVALLLAAGLYFTLRTRFVQLRMFGESFRVLREEKHEEGGVSSFQALMISTASRVGTGNIAGGIHRYLPRRCGGGVLDVAGGAAGRRVGLH